MNTPDSYMNEIFYFLRTVTIKFEPFAYHMGKTYMEQYAIDDPNGEWNPYYLNLSGQYAPDDEKMSVFSLETGEQIEFNNKLYVDSPKTYTIYRIPNKEYFTLEERYPANRGLIRCMVYPNGDLESVIAAPNLSLLGYDASLLEFNERESMLTCLRDFLKMVSVRWWKPEFSYEDLYPSAFWWIMWQYLPVLLLTQRFKNIKTSKVHSFHIWEYLKSKGLGDYRDILTNNQSLWLYRNIDYIQKNKGKNSNLILLADNLLGEVFVSLLYKDMHQESVTRWAETCVTRPEFVSYSVVGDEEEKVESFSNINSRLTELGLETEQNPEYVESEDIRLATHNNNRLPTKFLELKKDSVNSRNVQLMINFFLSTLFYRISIGHCAYNCELKDAYSSTMVELNVNDVVLLWAYSMWKSVGEEPGFIPTKYCIDGAFKTEQPQIEEISIEDSYIYLCGAKYHKNEVMDRNLVITSMNWEPRPFTSISSFMEALMSQYKTLLLYQKNLENSSYWPYQIAMKEFLVENTIRGVIEVRLTDYTSFQEWINSNLQIHSLLSNYGQEEDQMELYKKLAENCFDALFPIPSGNNDWFVGTTKTMDNLYSSIRKLFTQLISYNVTFLETDRDTEEYLHLTDPFLLPNKNFEYTTNNSFILVNSDLKNSNPIGEHWITSKSGTIMKTEISPEIGDDGFIHDRNLKYDIYFDVESCYEEQRDTLVTVVTTNVSRQGEIFYIDGIIPAHGTFILRKE